MSGLKRWVMGRLRANRWIRERVERIRDPDIGVGRLTQVFGRFTDSAGNQFELLSGLRDHIKPGWQAMLSPQAGYALPLPGEVRARCQHARAAVGGLVAALANFGVDLRRRRVLEIGCYDGSTTYGLADAGAGEVTGTDISRYYMNQSAGPVGSPEAVAAVTAYLDALRRIYAGAWGHPARPGAGDAEVRFVEDDIAASALPPESFDVICSWECLEHFTDAAGALRQIHRLLRPGGVAYHEYNPFFSLNGGHSLCTLDFVWGHVRLTEADFTRYLAEFRPGERELALRFYRQNLNRMTLADLAAWGADARLETLALVPWPRRSHWQLLPGGCLQQARRNHAALSPLDLISPTVWVVHRRPAA